MLSLQKTKMLPHKIIFLTSIILSLTSTTLATSYRTYEYNHTLDSKAPEFTPARDYALSDWTFIVDQVIKEKVRTPAIKGASWTYVLCDKPFSESERDTECTVYYETHDLNGVVFREECQDILENLTEREYRGFIRVYRFGKSKSILLWQNADKVVLLDVIHFPDCDVTRAKLQLSQKMTDCPNNGCIDVAVRNDEEFDVFFAKLADDSAVWYVTTFDAKGVKMKEPREFLNTNSRDEPTSAIMDRVTIVPMTPGSSIQKHLVLALDYQLKAYAWFLDKNGIRSQPPTDADIHIASTSHNRLGFCTIRNQILTCQQLDDRGSKKLEKTIKLQHHGRPTPDYLNSLVYGFRVAVMHNLPDGGFILVTEDCVSLKVCNRPADPYRLYIFKIGAHGTRYRTIVVQNLSRERKASHFVEPYGILENESGEYCLFKNYVLKDRDFSTQLVVECYSDELLSRSY